MGSEMCIRDSDEAALPIQHADNMQHAVELARAAAKPGDIIILSPASASFDLYPNFEVRGREFKKIVNELKWSRRSAQKPTAPAF